MQQYKSKNNPIENEQRIWKDSSQKKRVKILHKHLKYSTSLTKVTYIKTR